MVGFAIENGLVPDSAEKILLNGCEETALTSKKFWPVVQHFTVAELRTSLGIDSQPVGLGAGSARTFPGIAVTYEQQL
jgi:hypothetical protein